MDVMETKQRAGTWVEANLAQWPGLRGAHFVGGITSMPDDAPFPTTKDVDMHLIFDEGSPMLQSQGPFMNVIETAHEGIAIEAGVRSIAEYASPEAVLANPEVAHHLLTDCVTYDPDGWLRDLQAKVQRDYPRRRWVCARLDHERRGLAAAFALREMASAWYGASGELSLLGYTTTFVTAALAVATLKPPRVGGRMFINLGETLTTLGRPDLYDAALANIGVRDTDRALAERMLAEGAELFDRAVAVRRTPHPFQHKLNAHLRPYFVDSCQAMIDEGYHREALGWITPFYCASTDVLLADGTDAEVPIAAKRRDDFLSALGFGDPALLGERFVDAGRVSDEIFALADRLVAENPAITD